jgi:hypothetical protein
VLGSLRLLLLQVVPLVLVGPPVLEQHPALARHPVLRGRLVLREPLVLRGPPLALPVPLLRALLVPLVRPAPARREQAPQELVPGQGTGAWLGRRR